MANLVNPNIAAPVVDSKEIGIMPAAQVEAIFGTVKLDRQLLTPQDCEITMLQFGGAPAVLEAVAHGRLVNEVGIHLGLPLLWFTQWIESNVDGAQLAQAKLLGAETMMMKAQMVLSVDPTSTHEAAQARALAAEYVRVAEKLDHQKWGTRRADGLAGQTVNIQMNLGQGTTFHTTVDPHAASEQSDINPANRATPRADGLPARMTFAPLDPEKPLPHHVDLHVPEVADW